MRGPQAGIPADERPWLRHYPAGVPAELTLRQPTLVAALRQAAAEHGDEPAIRYFGRTVTWSELDALSSAFAAALAERGVGPGDRVALLLQNVPQFSFAVLAAWRLGAAVVPLNPMLRELEIRYHLEDSGARALVALESLHAASGAAAVAGTGVRCVVTTGDLDFAGSEEPPPIVPRERVRLPGTEDLLELLGAYASTPPPAPALAPDQLACLGYTSGTTGRPKGAMISHRNVVHQSEVYRVWDRVGGDDLIFAMAPLFHITGFVAHFGLSLLGGIPLVLSHRFDGAEALRQIERHRCTVTCGAITAFLAMLRVHEREPHDLSSLRVARSGGAPVAPATVARFRERTGVEILNVYGLTETVSPSHSTPAAEPTPIDEASGALSVGVPVPGHRVRIVDLESGQDVPTGELGELWTAGPGVVSGYWRRPDATADSFTDGYLHTGDVGRMDAEGWFYLVDRAKDMINASGYKVWPREVEDYLFEHPAVREVAVVGAPDAYRGETVVAFVALTDGAVATVDDLLRFCRGRMAAYKCPRRIELVDEVPKTATGKFLRRELRDRLQVPSPDSPR
ncbi:MAG: AMP-binding protein [Candidatus Dormiibacterota bacterium]